MKIAGSPCAPVLAVLLSGSFAFAQTALTTARAVQQVQLRPTSKAPITLHLADESNTLYLALGKMTGLHVLFDPDYQPRKAQVDLTDASLTDALRILGMVTNTFYEPLSPDTIYVAANSRQKHMDLDQLETETFYLRNSPQQADANEIVTALRNILPPEAKAYLVASQGAIVLRTTPQQLAEAQAIFNDLDQPKKTYRLTYTVSDMDGTKATSVEHYSMNMAAGQNNKLKQGSKVPIATGTYNAGTAAGTNPAGLQTQFTYLDVGMNFDATLQSEGNGAMLKCNVERSAVASEQSGVGPQDPIVRQTSLQGTFYLPLGKSTTLGSIEMPGTTHHLEVEAVLQQLP